MAMTTRSPAGRRRGPLARAVWAGVAGTLVVFVVLEGLLRAVYAVRNSFVQSVPAVYGFDYGPIPPWAEGLRILEADSVLIWKGRPRVQRAYLDVFSPAPRAEDRVALLHRFRPGLPAAFEANRVYDVSLNSDGFRDVEFPRRKSPSTFRILCLGDSWTFGASVGQAHAYPQRLQARLRQEFPHGNFEVFNLGMLGYTSFQGLEVLKATGLGLDPDFVVVGFAVNDHSIVGWRDKDVGGRGGKNGRAGVPVAIRRQVMEKVEQRLQGWGRDLESYKLLRYFALAARWRYHPIGEQLRPSPSPPEPARSASAQEPPPLRVAPPDFERNIRELIRLAHGRGAGAMLLLNTFDERDDLYRRAVRTVAATEGVPLVDGAALFADARRRIEAEIETRLDLRPPPEPPRATGDAVEVVFRVYLGTRPVPKAMYIVGNHPALGSGIPNRIAMYDDRTHGDQRADDAVWSYTTRLPRGTKVAYTYTNSGEPGAWEHVDVPDLRTVTVDAGTTVGRLYVPIDSFGRIYVKGDPWHTDALGYDLLAQSVMHALKATPRFKAVADRRAAPSGARPHSAP
jgi:hypothetical protein